MTDERENIYVRAMVAQERAIDLCENATALFGQSEQATDHARELTIDRIASRDDD